MIHYSIILNRPESILRQRFPAVRPRRLYNTEQHLVWDGPARKRDVVKLYDALSPYCAGIILSAGSGPKGRTILSQGEFS